MEVLELSTEEHLGLGPTVGWFLETSIIKLLEYTQVVMEHRYHQESLLLEQVNNIIMEVALMQYQQHMEHRQYQHIPIRSFDQWIIWIPRDNKVVAVVVKGWWVSWTIFLKAPFLLFTIFTIPMGKVNAAFYWHFYVPTYARQTGRQATGCEKWAWNFSTLFIYRIFLQMLQH